MQRGILAELQEAESLAESERAEPQGRFIVTAPQVFGRLHVAPLLCTFMKGYPKLQAELLLSDRIANLVEEGIDVAVRIGSLPDSSDMAKRVGVTRHVLVASPDYLSSAGTPRTLEELAGHRLISFTGLSQPRQWRFRTADGDRDVSVAPAFVTNSADAAIGHAVRGGGLTRALSYQVVEQVRAGLLEAVLCACEPPPLPIHLVFPSSRLLSIKVRAFIDLTDRSRELDLPGRLTTASACMSPRARDPAARSSP
jgi:DNA-binding transcriptional LysR family regulator